MPHPAGPAWYSPEPPMGKLGYFGDLSDELIPGYLILSNDLHTMAPAGQDDEILCSLNLVVV